MEKSDGPKDETNEQKQSPGEARCWIDKGILRVEVPLFMPNGEFLAYGMLHKAMQSANNFYRMIEREAAKERKLTNDILTPVGGMRTH